MNRAVLYAVASCVLWGTAFLAPIVLKGWSPWAVAGGRYVAYGLISLLLLIASRTLFTLPLRWWRDALWLSLLGNAVYYVLLSASLQLAGPFAPSVIIGTLPITLALAGRALDRQHHHKAAALGIPLSLIAAGLICVNWAEYHANSENNTSQNGQYWLGIACAVLAHIAWLLFGLWNARYLKTHTTISSSQWGNLLGASLLPAAIGMLGRFYCGRVYHRPLLRLGSHIAVVKSFACIARVTSCAAHCG
jgi:drug/metabolite transporter (DMT)-like permease